MRFCTPKRRGRSASRQGHPSTGRRCGPRRAAAWLLVAAGLLAGPAQADRPQWAWQTFPFDQSLNIEAVHEVTHSAPEQLVATIRRWGVDVLRVSGGASRLPVNPLLAVLPEAPAELLQRAGFRDSYTGLVVHGEARCCSLRCDTILIRDTAPAYTLIHEFVQSLLRPTCTGEADDVVEERFGAAFRRLVVYQRRLFDDPYKLLNPQWRRDILAAQADVANDLHGRLRLGQSQEAIVEKLLSRYIDEHSPFYDADRRAEGRRYGEMMIDNAIDVFNTLNDSVVFVAETVVNLRQALRDGSLEPEAGETLGDDDVTAARQAAQAVEARLAVVRAELQALKAFFTR